MAVTERDGLDTAQRHELTGLLRILLAPFDAG
jgi:hypothetical protein